MIERIVCLAINSKKTCQGSLSCKNKGSQQTKEKLTSTNYI